MREVLVEDVLSAAKALSGVQGSEDLQLAIQGAGAVPQLPGLVLSEGTTVFVKRGRDGKTYVRGSREGMSATYFLYRGGWYTTE
jgi:hypothetical protein